MNSWLHRLTTAAACIFGMTASPAHAQDSYPSRVVRIIVPYPAGGIVDKVAREVGQKLQERFGQSVIVENRAGAAGNIGMDYAAKQPADGYTLALAPASNLTVNAVLFKNLTYDIQKDFTPVSLLILTPQVLVMNPMMKVKTLNELLAYGKTAPNGVSYGSPGIGSFSHLAGELMKFETGVNFVHVPYQGLAPAVNDLLGGQTQLMFVEAVIAAPHVKAGKLTAIAVAYSKRVPWLPDVPTMAEAGMPGLEVSSWSGMVARAGTPAPVLARLSQALREIMQTDDMKRRYDEIGAFSIGSSPEEFSRFISSETVKWTEVVRKAGIQPQ